MSKQIDPQVLKYTASIKTQKKLNKSHLLTVNEEGNRYLFSTAPRVNLKNETIQQRVLDSEMVESYKRFIHDRILDVDTEDFSTKLQAYGYGDCAIYTWILKSTDTKNSTIENVKKETPVKVYMTKVVSIQELGTLHYDLNLLHPRESLETGPVIGAGELKVLSPTKIEFNLLSGTFMAQRILKNKNKIKQHEITNKILNMFSKKLQSKGFEVSFNANKDLIEGSCFVTPKETMNTLRKFFKKSNTRRKNKTANDAAGAAGAGAGQAAPK